MTFRRLAAAAGMVVVIVSAGCGAGPSSDSAAADGAVPGAAVVVEMASGPVPVGDSIRAVRAEQPGAVAPTTTLAGPIADTRSMAPGPDARIHRNPETPSYLSAPIVEPAPDPVAVTFAAPVLDPAPVPKPAAANPAPATVTTSSPPADTQPTATPVPVAAPEPVVESPPATTIPAPTPVAEVDTGASGQFAAAINALRAEVGVGSLSRNGDLDARALAWAQYMAGASDLSHSGIVSDLVGSGWATAGENIGYGPSVDAVFAGLRASSGHYTNMVNPAFTNLGVAAVVDGNGVVWTAHLFAG